MIAIYSRAYLKGHEVTTWGRPSLFVACLFTGGGQATGSDRLPHTCCCSLATNMSLYLCADVYHPLLLFNREGDCLAAKLRSGNVHSADDWEELLLPEIERQQKLGKEVAVSYTH